MDLKQIWTNYIGLSVVQTFFHYVLRTQPWHLSIFGERVEDKGVPILDTNQQPPHCKWDALTS